MAGGGRKCRVVVEGGGEIGKAEGEKGKINTASTLLPLHGKERGSIVVE